MALGGTPRAPAMGVVSRNRYRADETFHAYRAVLPSTPFVPQGRATPRISVCALSDDPRSRRRTTREKQAALDQNRKILQWRRYPHRTIYLGPMRWDSFQQPVTVDSIKEKILSVDIADIATAARVWAGLRLQLCPDIFEINISEDLVNEVTAPNITIAVDSERCQSRVTGFPLARPTLGVPTKVGVN